MSPGLTAEQRHLGDMPGVGEAADDKLVAVVSWRVLCIKEEPEGR